MATNMHVLVQEAYTITPPPTPLLSPLFALSLGFIPLMKNSLIRAYLSMQKYPLKLLLFCCKLPTFSYFFLLFHIRTYFFPTFLAGLQSNSGLWIDDVRLSVRLSVCLSVCQPFWLTWLTSAFKFVLSRINQYRLDTLNENRPG